MTGRNPDHPVKNLFVERWSPRAFDGSDMPEADLKTILEAARWSPSAFNIQPWRFVYARRGGAHWETLVNLLNPFNRDWAQHASALVYLFSDTEVDGKDGKPNRASGTHSFDAGAAWAHAALQATELGYHTHGMAGIVRDEIHEQLGVPERFKAEIAFAIGKRGDVAALPESLQERETPSGRKPLSEIAFAGSWG
ncbi:nitroreductase family protein [Roseibium sp. MMSF_3544]|uniref:nitroreductase family protein n=1 Tax=unclassified Roseibium TaxID=2629323 RepID=UPI00273CFABB|nr:nitroreductase family protein [Roseibium sp. MMSF_3544]